MKYSLAEKKSSRKKTYIPDLNEMLSQCELNYLLLQRLSANFTNLGDQDTISMVKQPPWCVHSNVVDLTFEIVEVSKYTMTMKLTIKSPRISLIEGIGLIVRAYHDAKMLEVMEGSGPSALKAIHDEPEHKTKPVDEKIQINRFVGESLRACLNLENASCGIS